MITLYTAATPNGHKISILLEELGLEYKVHALELGKQEQKEDWYLKINPNGRIPAIVDHDNGDFPVFESGAIMLYLAAKTGKLLPMDINSRWVATQWLMFQMGGVGPMMGQANVFFRYFPEKIQPAIDRYQGEVKRLFGVLDRHLASHEYLADEYSIADIANFAWVTTHEWSGVSLKGFPNLSRWVEKIRQRPAVRRGLAVPPPKMTEMKGESADTFIGEARKII